MDTDTTTTTVSAMLSGQPVFLAHDGSDWAIWSGDVDDYAPVPYLYAWQADPALFPLLVRSLFGEIGYRAVTA